MFLQNPQILIVEDIKKFRDGLRAIFEPLTPHIFEAVDGLEALKMAKKQYFDIIFLSLFFIKKTTFAKIFLSPNH